MMDKYWIYVAMTLLLLGRTCVSQDVTYYLEEEQPIGTFVGNIAKDSNLLTAYSGIDSSLVYSFITTGRNHADLFSVNEKTSDLYTATVIDRENVCEFMEVCMLSLQVAAKSPLGSFFRILKLTIYIKDRNDHSPLFEEQSLIQDISEAVLVGTSFAIDGARDKDTSAAFSLQSYDIVSNDSLEQKGIPFTVQFVKHLDGSSTIRLFVTEQLDREIMDSYNFDIVAKDGGTPPRIGKLPVVIRVTDENDNPPMFTSDAYEVNITESFPVSGIIITIVAEDPDFENNGRVGYRFSPHQSSDHFRYFQIDEVTGDISLKERMKYTPNKTFNLIIEAFDHASNGKQLTSQTLVVIEMTNEGNSPPQIKVSKLSGAVVSELANIGTVTAYIRIEDHDTGRQGIVGCILDSTHFNIQPIRVNQYKVIVSKVLDYEKQASENVTVHCQDDGIPPLQASKSFLITVRDENDHSPYFTSSSYSKYIRENIPVAQTITTLDATDHDSGYNGLVYFVVSTEVKGIFYFDNSTTPINTADLRLNRTLDRETKPSYLFPVYVIDKGIPAKTGTATISIYLTDINDHVPVFSTSPLYLTVEENKPAGARVGTLTARDGDLGNNSRLRYGIHPEEDTSLPFIVSENGLIQSTRLLDKEEKDEYAFRVIVSDNGDPSLSSSGRVVVNINDVNDNSPVFEFPSPNNDTIYVFFSTMPWQVIAHVRAVDSDEIGKGNYQLKYSIHERNDSNHFQINPRTGEVQLIQELDVSYLGMTYQLDIFVSDWGMPRVRSTMKPLFIQIIASNTTQTQNKTDAFGGKNFIIIVIVGCVTVLLSLGILVTICLIGKMDRQRKRADRNRTVDIDLDTKPFDGSITVFSLPSEDSLINDRRRKEVSFSIDDDVFSDDDLLQNKCSERRNNHFSPSIGLSRPVPNQSNTEDNHSIASGDTGTSDSGRGGSDDETQTKYARSPPQIKHIIDVNTEIQPMAHQEIIPFSFKKGISLLRNREYNQLGNENSFSRFCDMELCDLNSDRPTNTHGPSHDICANNAYRHNQSITDVTREDV